MGFREIKEHLSCFSVGIAGAGGLGSNCAASLVRCGIGSVIIADFDFVEKSNLNRQFYFQDQTGKPKTEALKENLLRINPFLKISAHHVVVNSENAIELFRDCDVVVEAFDRADMKEMLIEALQSSLPGTPIIVGSGVAGWGDNNSIKSRKIDDTLYVCGDESTVISDDTPPMAPRVGIVSNMQANLVVEILMNKKKKNS